MPGPSKNLFGWGSFGNWSSAFSDNNSMDRTNLKYKDFSPDPLQQGILKPPAAWIKPQSMMRQCDIQDRPFHDADSQDLEEGSFGRGRSTINTFPAPDSRSFLALRNSDQNNNATSQPKGKAKLTLRLRQNEEENASNYVEIPIIRISSEESTSRSHKKTPLKVSPDIDSDSLSDYENLDDDIQSIKLNNSPLNKRSAAQHLAGKAFKSSEKPTSRSVVRGYPSGSSNNNRFGSNYALSSQCDRPGFRLYDDSAQDDDMVHVEIDDKTKTPYFNGDRWIDESDYVLLDQVTKDDTKDDIEWIHEDINNIIGKSDDPYAARIDLCEESSESDELDITAYEGPPQKLHGVQSLILVDGPKTDKSKVAGGVQPDVKPSSSKVSGDRLEDDVIITAESKGEVQRHKPRYFQQIEEDILSSDMLSDEAINLGQNLLHKQFPEMGGLEDTSIGAVFNFAECKKANFIQIMHDLSCHWVCVTDIGCKPGEVKLYDTLYYGIIKPAIQKQITCLTKPQSKHLTVNVQAIQRQQNSTDCGVFALAQATSLLMGHDPTRLVYDISQLRPHLMSCLEKGKMTPFPTLIENGDMNTSMLLELVERIKPESIKISLVCSCRAPYNAYDKLDDLVACKMCKGLFHMKCENIPFEALEIDINWQCTNCRRCK